MAKENLFQSLKSLGWARRKEMETAVKETGAPQLITSVSNLDDLKNIPIDQFVDTFYDNLEIIFRYALTNIQETLQAFDMETLNLLHKKLCDKAVLLFPQYNNHRTRNRQMKHTIIPDLCILGHSLVNQQCLKDLDKIFIPKETISTMNADQEQEHEQNKTDPRGTNCADISDVPVIVTEMKNTITSLLAMVNSLTRKIEIAEQTRREDHYKLTSDNKELRQMIGDLTTRMNQQSWSSFKHDMTPKQSLLLGSRLIRDIDENKLLNTKVICQPEAHIIKLKKELEKLPKDYDTITIATGGNDCATQDGQSASNIIQTLDDLIDTAKTHANKVVVSSVCPRAVTPSCQDTIDTVNEGIQQSCLEKGAHFVDNSSAFYLKDGSINDGYLLNDGVHITRRATNKLATNLKLNIKNQHQGVCKSGKSGYEKNYAQNSIKSLKTSSQKRVHIHKDRTYDYIQDDNVPVYTDRGTEYHDDHLNQAKYTYDSTHVSPDLYRKKTRNDDHSQDVRCHNCYESNHTLARCRYDKPVVCFRCGKTGHKEKHHDDH